MDLVVNKPMSHRYFITKINEHTFLLENVLTNQIWNIEILEEDSINFTQSGKGRTHQFLTPSL